MAKDRNTHEYTNPLPAMFVRATNHAITVPSASASKLLPTVNTTVSIAIVLKDVDVKRSRYARSDTPDELVSVPSGVTLVQTMRTSGGTASAAEVTATMTNHAFVPSLGTGMDSREAGACEDGG